MKLTYCQKLVLLVSPEFLHTSPLNIFTQPKFNLGVYPDTHAWTYTGMFKNMKYFFLKK